MGNPSKGMHSASVRWAPQKTLNAQNAPPPLGCAKYGGSTDARKKKEGDHWESQRVWSMLLALTRQTYDRLWFTFDKLRKTKDWLYFSYRTRDSQNWIAGLRCFNHKCYIQTELGNVKCCNTVNHNLNKNSTKGKNANLVKYKPRSIIRGIHSSVAVSRLSTPVMTRTVQFHRHYVYTGKTRPISAPIGPADNKSDLKILP